MENKSDYAYQELKNRIISGQMPPLSDVSEEQLQKELGVSRTPIREAIQKLEKEHFVMIYPRRGTLVSDITLDLIYSIYEVRLLNEPFIARSACRYIVNEWIDHMYTSFSTTFHEKEGEQQRDYYIELDRELHNTLTSHSPAGARRNLPITLFSHTNNFMLKDTFRVVNDHNHRIRILTSQRNMNYQRSINEHLAILEALRLRDESQLENAVREHILTAKQEAFEYYY